ncbi:potassium channel, subfamily K, member 16-like [Sander vitreus]
MGIKEMLNLARVPSILMLGVVYVAYVLIGGVVFWKLEGDLGQKDISVLLLTKEQVLNTYKCLNQEGLESVAQVVQAASKVGLSLKGNYTADGFWKFTSSAVFAATVVTTIGYGNISPRSTAGQIFCVFFALFGIPLNMVVLNRVGKYMLAIERNISDFLEGKTGRRRCTRFFVHLVSYLSGAVLFFVVPMIVFQLQEGWTLSQAIYFCFITLSTIGFGDFVADSNPDKVYPQWYSILMASWIFFGLAWLALLINHSMDILERLNTHLKQFWGGREQEEVSGSAEVDNPDTQVEEEDEIKKAPITQETEAANATLIDRIDDLENRSRRANLRVINVPEGSEPNGDMVTFISTLLRDMMFATPPVLDRAHRALMQKPKDGRPPRAIIVAFHRYQDRERALRWARQNEMQYKGHALRLYPNLSANLSRKRVAYKNVKSALYQKGVQFRLLYPARLRVSYGGETLMFETPLEAKAFYTQRIERKASTSADPEHED